MAVNSAKDDDFDSCSWTTKFQEGCTNKYFGYVQSMEAAMAVIRQYELETTTKFSCVKSVKDFGFGDPFSKPRKVYFKNEVIPFDGVPYTIIGLKVFECQHGPDRKKAFKEKLAQQKAEDHSFNKRRFLPQNTMKFDCPARIQLSEVIKFPKYEIRDDTARLRRDTSRKLNVDMGNAEKPQFERRIYIHLPKEDEHKGHVIGKDGGVLQPIDKSLVEKISILVGEGVKTVDEMKRHLRHFVKHELFLGQIPPQTTNRRYYPTNVDIRNHMYTSSVRLLLSKVDQQNLELKINNWKLEHPEDSFFFRPCAISPAFTETEANLNTNEDCVQANIAQKLLYAHQTAWQKRLMRRYGNEITLLDATYKTMRYELPLFFLVVKTNVNYIVVGSFIIQNETTASIEEALGIFRDWNADWKPKYFMTDFCSEEINAIENTFEDATTYICDFHREQCWERWLRKTENGLNASRNETLTLLRNIAKSSTEECFQQNLALLRENTLWLNNPKLRNWFEKTWIVEAKRWVWAFRQDRFMISINTNNGIERQNESLKYQYLKDRRSYSLSGMITILIDDFLPDKYKRYVELNTRFCDQYKRYNPDVPKYLHNKPRAFLKHCMSRITTASEIPSEHIRSVDGETGHFTVRSQANNMWYNLYFGAGDVMPKCSCLDFTSTGLPCKHFFAVFEHSPKWQWDALPEMYRENPHLSLDRKCTLNDAIDDNEEDGHHNMPVPLAQAQPKGNLKTAACKLQRNAVNCRETLKCLTSLTYNIEDSQALEEMRSSLKLMLDKFAMYQKVDDKEAVPLQLQIENKVDDKENLTPSLQGDRICKVPSDQGYLPLPVRPKKKRFANRVGRHAAMMRTNYNVNVPLASNVDVNRIVTNRNKQKKQARNNCVESLVIETHVVPSPKKAKTEKPNQICEIVIDKEYPDPLQWTKCSMSQKADDKSHLSQVFQIEEKLDGKENQPLPLQVQDTNKECESLASCTDANRYNDKKQARKNCLKFSPLKTKPNQSCEVIDEDTPELPQWVSIAGSGKEDVNFQLILYQETKNRILEKGTWLSDSEIHAGQMLLKKQFPFVDGLEDPALRGSLVVPATTEFVQIVNVGSHWVCISTFPRTSSDTVKVFDSLYHQPNPTVIEHACRMLMHPSDKVHFANEKVQKQVGSSDCGLFALAFATDLCNGLEPAKQNYDQRSMRKHYVRCLEFGRMEPFPKSMKRVAHHLTCSRLSVAVYCVCRLPNDGHEYVQCFGCLGWYHPVCVPIPKWAVTTNRKWKCATCS